MPFPVPSSNPVSTPLPNAAEGGVASPCTQVCRIDAATGWCEGCRRTLAEIAEWSTLDDAARRAVWAALPQRHPADPATPAPPETPAPPAPPDAAAAAAGPR